MSKNFLNPEQKGYISKAKKPINPEHSGYEFNKILEQFMRRSPEHARVAKCLVEDPAVLTKDGSRLNKTALYRAVNMAPIDRPDFDSRNEDHYKEVPETEKINSRRIEDILLEFTRCFEYYE
jgi:hypothetical protein